MGVGGWGNGAQVSGLGLVWVAGSSVEVSHDGTSEGEINQLCGPSLAFDSNGSQIYFPVGRGGERGG